MGPFLPTGLRHFSALAVSPSLSVALGPAGRWGPRNPIKPALGSWRSSENWQQRGIRGFFNSLLEDTFRAGHAFDTRVDCGGDVERPGKRFENAFGHVMRVASGENFDVQIHGRADRNGPEKLLD